MLEIDTELLESSMNKKEDYLDTKIQDNQNDEKLYYDEENLLEEHEKDFDYQIRQRGLDYYHSNNVINIFKDKKVMI